MTHGHNEYRNSSYYNVSVKFQIKTFIDKGTAVIKRVATNMMMAFMSPCLSLLKPSLPERLPRERIPVKGIARVVLGFDAALNRPKGTMKPIAIALEEAGIEFINENCWVGVSLNLDLAL